MSIQTEIDKLQTHAEGYASWGNLDIQYVGIRKDNSIHVLNVNENKEIDITNESIQDNLQYVVIKEIFAKRKNIQAVIIAKQMYGSSVKTEIPSILDDQAQLLGVSIKIAHIKQTTANVNRDYVIRALRGRFACIDSDGLVYSIGDSLEDTYVAAWLVEKTSKAFLESKYLGGAKSINKIEAWLMHKFYRLKYSKEAEKNK